MGQDIFDTATILILTFFAIRGYLNGFVGEVAAIVSLIGGFWAAHTFHPLLSPHLQFIGEPLWRNMASYVIIFIAVIIAVAIIAKILQRILQFALISWADRVAGGILGLAKGIIIFSIIFILLNKFCANADFYKHSRVRPYFNAIINQIRTSLPPDIVKRFERLIAPDGCPWDRVQTPESLSEYIIEESHELVSAIRYGDADDVCEELGDVAFLLVTIACHFEKKGAFTLDDVFRRNAAKMVHRHPHVFGNEKFASLDEQLKAWEKLKKEEHQKEGKATGVFASLPRDLDPLARAYRIHSKAARTGFTWENDEDVERQVEAEWLEFLDAENRDSDAEVKHELGDLLFTIAELGRRHGMKANEALDYANERFLSRFKRMEELAAERKKDLTDMSLDEKNELWEQAKQEEKGAGTEKPAVAPSADAPLTKKD